MDFPSYTPGMGQPRPRYDAAGVVFIIATLLGWSSVLLFLKYLTDYIDGWTANGWRYGLSALLWLPILILGARRGTLPEGIWRRAFWPSVVNCIGQSCFALAPYYIGPGLEGFLLRFSILFSVGGALILFADERVLVRSGAFWGGMVLLVGGMFGTVLLGNIPLSGGTLIGILLGLGAGAFFGLYALGVRYYMRGVPAMTSFAAISLYTAIGMVGAMILMGRRHGLVVTDLSPFGWAMLVLSALIGIALGHVFYYAALARLGVAVASAVIQLAPFLNAIGALFIFGEELTRWQWISGFVLFAGALVILWAEQARRRGPGTPAAAAKTKRRARELVKT